MKNDCSLNPSIASAPMPKQRFFAKPFTLPLFTIKLTVTGHEVEARTNAGIVYPKTMMHGIIATADNCNTVVAANKARAGSDEAMMVYVNEVNADDKTVVARCKTVNDLAEEVTAPVKTTAAYTKTTTACTKTMAANIRVNTNSLSRNEHQVSYQYAIRSYQYSFTASHCLLASYQYMTMLVTTRYYIVSSLINVTTMPSCTASMTDCVKTITDSFCKMAICMGQVRYTILSASNYQSAGVFAAKQNKINLQQNLN
jgi:hypothetical protein